MNHRFFRPMDIVYLHDRSCRGAGCPRIRQNYLLPAPGGGAGVGAFNQALCPLDTEVVAMPLSPRGARVSHPPSRTIRMT